MGPTMGRVLILLDTRGKKYAVPAEGEMIRAPELGTFDAAKLRANVGRRIVVGGRGFLVLEPSTRDLRDTMKRGAQTLASKDLAVLCFEANVGAGARVVEAGAGSGGLTMALAHACGPSGHVVSYDVREEALKVARLNASQAGAETIVEFRIGDVRAGIPDRDVDAFVLDLLDPWNAVEAAWEALRPCGHFASFSPNMEQVKETVMALRRRPFVDVRTVEVIEREMEVREVGVRPSFAPLGHTGYLTFARKVLETF